METDNAITPDADVSKAFWGNIWDNPVDYNGGADWLKEVEDIWRRNVYYLMNRRVAEESAEAQKTRYLLIRWLLEIVRKGKLGSGWRG